MSLYRPIPQLQLAANVQQPLSPLSLRDYGKLLYWIFFFPQALRDYLALPDSAPPGNATNAATNTTATAPPPTQQRRQRTVVWMSALLLLGLLLLSGAGIFAGQTQWANLAPKAALQGDVAAIPLGAVVAALVFALASWRKQPAQGVVLGVASGTTTSILTMLGLGDLLDSRFLDMVTALGYGFVGGSSIGIVGNLANTLRGKAQPSAVHSVGGAGLAGLLIFLLNSTNYTEFVFNPDLSQENLLAALSGAVAFYGGAYLGQRRPLDWLISKIHLNFQLRDLLTDTSAQPYLRGKNVVNSYAPALEAFFAPITTPAQPIHLPHVTLYRIRQLPGHLQTWLEYDWEAGLANAAQLWRYTNQKAVVTSGVHQLLAEADSAKQTEKIAQFVGEVNKEDWPLILYPAPGQSLRDRLFAKAKPPTATAKLSATQVSTQQQRQQFQQHLLRLALVPQALAQRPQPLVMNSTAQQAIAGFWHLKDAFIDESAQAFQQLPADAFSKELQGITQSIQKLLNTKNMVTSPTVELPERPKEPKRKATWDALDNFKPVVRYGWLYHQCKTEERRQAVVGVATHKLDEIVKDAEKIPQPERDLIIKLTDCWRQEFQQWTAATRSAQRMKPANPFIFLEPLRGRPPFVNRDSQLKALKQAGTRGSLQPVLLSGLVHSGKSSLIHKAIFEYKDDVLFVIFNIPEAVNGVVSATQVYEAMVQSLKRRLQLRSTDEDLMAFNLDPAGETKKLIRNICYRYKPTLVLVVGNVDQLAAVPGKATLQGMMINNSATLANSLFTFWWQLTQEVGNLSFVFVSYAPELPNTPFTSLLKKITIAHLTIKDVLKLLTTPTPDFTPLFAPEAVNYIFNLTGGQPFLVQLIASCVTDRFNQTLDKDDKLEPVFLIADVEAVLQTAALHQFSQPYFRTLCDELETLYTGSLIVLNAIAQHSAGSGAAEVEQALAGQMTWAQVENTLTFLQTQQVVKYEDERWQIVGELLRRYLA